MKKTILFVVVNGAGLGHLTRGLAVARQIKKINSDYDIIFLTTSLATEVIREAGFMFYYLPTKTLVPVSGQTWNDYLTDQLQAIIRFHRPIALLYDGAYPYGGLIGGLKSVYPLKSIWIRRQSYKEDKYSSLEKYFDLILIPKETSQDQIEERPRTKICEPIIYLEKEEAHPREQIRSALGLTESKRLIYIQLGAGRINEIEPLIDESISYLLKQENNYVLLGESIIGKHYEKTNERVIVLRNYPNAQYFKALDAAISAAGYNTFHELLYFGVPTLFIPNLNTTIDSQEARAHLAATQGAALSMLPTELNKLPQKIDQLLSTAPNLATNAKTLVNTNGSHQAAQTILNFLTPT